VKLLRLKQRKMYQISREYYGASRRQDITIRRLPFGFWLYVQTF